MIRKMESRDLEQVAELEKVCFSEAWSWKLLEAGIHSPYDVYYVFEQDEQILYESYGFTAEAVRKGYYRNPSEDAVIMWKRNL